MRGIKRAPVSTRFALFPNNPQVLKKSKWVDKYQNIRERRIFSTPLQLLWRHISVNKVLGDLSGYLRERFFRRKRFIPFRIDDYAQNRRAKRTTTYKMMVLAYRRLRLFYGDLKEPKMRKLLDKTKPNQHASFVFGLMERRLDVLLWRTNFCTTIHAAQQMVRSGKVLVDGIRLRNFYYPIKTFQYVELASSELTRIIKWQLFEKLRLRNFKFPPLKYVKVDYRLMLFYCIPIVEPYKFVPMSYKLRHASLKKYIR